MTLIDEAVAEFGKSIGMNGLALRENGSLMLDMKALGRLSIELIGERREDVAIGLIRRVEMPDDKACERLLELCHYRAPAPFPVRVGLTGLGDLIFAVRMDAYQFTVPNVHQSLNWLMGLQDQSSSFLREA